MKKVMFLATFLLLSSFGFSQVRFGVRGGASTMAVDANELEFPKNLDTLLLGVKNAKLGFHFGVFLQASMGKFFLQPEVVFNSNSTDFSLKDLSSSDGRETILNERYQYLDIPFMLGAKFGALRLQGGPVGHFFLSSKSDLFQIENYEQAFEDMTYGWQAGIGLDVWNVVFDIKYEGNFNKFGDHIVVDGNPYSFNDSASRWVISLGISLW